MSNLLYHSPADIIATLMIQRGLGVTPNVNSSVNSGTSWPIKVNRLPDKPDNCIVVTDTTGQDQGRLQPTSKRVVKYGIQIRIRSGTFPLGFVKAEAIAYDLDSVLDNTVLDLDTRNYLIHSLQRTGPVIRMGIEQNATRELFSLNYLVDLRLLS